MSTVVILDADFLSAFLKIERLPLLLTFYQVERLYVPSAVYREVAVTSLLPALLAVPWIGVEDPTPERLQAVAGDETFGVLGAANRQRSHWRGIIQAPLYCPTIGRCNAWRPAAA